MGSLEARSQPPDPSLGQEATVAPTAEVIDFPRNRTGRTLEEIDEQWLVITVGRMLEEMGVDLKVITPPNDDEVGLASLKIEGSGLDSVWDLLDSFNDTVANADGELTLQRTPGGAYQLWSYAAQAAMESGLAAFPTTSKGAAELDKRAKYNLADYIIQQRDDSQGWRPEEY